jgi:hypothetical protein
MPHQPNVRNGWKADIVSATPTAMRGTFALIALCGVGGCRQAAIGEAPNFSVHARHIAEAPQTVFITVSNQSADYLCVPSAEVRLGSGFINVLPESSSDVFENRPPPDLLGGMDVSEGVKVIPPKTKRDLFLDLSQLEGRSPPPTGLRGKVHAVACRDLFISSRPRVNEQAFGVSLMR